MALPVMAAALELICIHQNATYKLNNRICPGDLSG